jgi:hypothetical protein
MARKACRVSGAASLSETYQRALIELGIRPIPAYSPQARGRSERASVPGKVVCRRSYGCVVLRLYSSSSFGLDFPF